MQQRRSDPTKPMLPCGCSATFEQLRAKQDEARRNPREGPWPWAERDRRVSRAVERLMRPHVGRWDGVIHEIDSWIVYLEVHLNGPREGHPWCDLFTTGMSQRGVAAPVEPGETTRTELCMRFPGNWAEGENLLHVIDREDRFWAVDLLRWVARRPHERRRRLHAGSLVLTGPPYEGHPFDSVIVLRTVRNGRPLAPLLRKDGETVGMLSLVPLLPPETAYAQRYCPAHADVTMRALGLDEVVRVDRPSLV